MNEGYIVAAIGTDVGKTIISAMLVEALEADYWKPVQAGALDFTDTDVVGSLISNTKSVLHPEAFRLTQPMSPHAAARVDHVEIRPEKISLPTTDRFLIVELAGGIMVPLSDSFSNLEFIQQLDLPLIVVANYYLGSINHTLLTLEVLKKNNINTKGIIFNGKTNQESKAVIMANTDLPCLADIPESKEVNKNFILKHAQEFKHL